MSKLEELIQRYCPDGVEWSTIGEVCQKVFAGGTPTSSNSSYYGGDIPWLRSGEVNFNEITSTEKTITEAGYNSSSARWVESQSVLVAMTGATVARSAITMIELTANQSVCALVPIREILNYRFLYYWVSKSYLQMKGMAQGALTSLNLNLIKSIEIPVPPLPVQEEIVRVLDAFTELQAELQAEQQKRVQQYSYYREKLLNNSSQKGVKEYTVQDLIISLKTGLNPRQSFKLNEPGTSCPYITGKDIFSNKVNVSEKTDTISEEVVALINKRAKLERDLLLFASTGTGTVGRMAIIEEYNNDWNISETLYAIKPNKSLISTSFLMHSLYADYTVSQFTPKISKGSVPHLKIVDLLGVRIKVPSLEDQKRIVYMLDRFDTLTNVLLPAEIEKRRQQYEYYRDQLLTFKRL